MSLAFCSLGEKFFLETYAMEAINEVIANLSQTTENTPEISVPPTAEQTVEKTPFGEFMKAALGKSAGEMVSEEELFAGLIQKHLADLDSGGTTDAESMFKETFARTRKEMTRADGYVPIEKAAKQSLTELKNEGVIDESTASRVLSESFRAAQLDDNLEALYDDRGSGSDPTIAVAALEEAIAKLEGTTSQIASGEITADEMSIPAPSATTAETRPLDGGGGFLWKPISESNGKLVVLLPTDLPESSVDRVEIHQGDFSNGEEFSDSTKVEEGTFSGDSHNGGRAHYRFDHPGASYGTDLWLVSFLNDGSAVSYQIADGAERND